jgi:superfamily II DNA or RNA helicase
MPNLKYVARTSLKDVLSHLTFTQAAKLLGEHGKERLSAGSALYHADLDLDAAARLEGNSFALDLYDATVTVLLSDAHRYRLACSCSACGPENPECPHVPAALSIILEEKTALGLAKPPPERVAVERLSEEALIALALREREERSRKETMRVTPDNPQKVWGEYSVFNPASGKTYRVSLRGWERGQSFCDCPDFRKNTLGTCKHVMRVVATTRKKCRRPAAITPWRPDQVEVYLDYAAAQPEIRLNLPDALDAKAEKLLSPYAKNPVADIPAFVKALQKLSKFECDAVVFPDALEHIQHRLFQEHMAGLASEIRRDPKKHSLRKTLLKTELLPYQIDGIAFAAGAGRAVLADDMGLGKTIQGIGVAELLAREAGINRVLIVCPASLKSQWLEEIAKFSERDALLIQGPAEERAAQYAGPQFFTICNYEQTLRDHRYIDEAKWDLIILDEAQRIKNWEAATTRVVKSLKSRFALALTGTPMENRLEELYTVVSFVDEHRLGPAFRFLNTHREADDKGHVLGYRRIRELRERLSPILLRRTRDMVMKELPPRHTEVIRIAPSEEQLALHGYNLRIVSQVVAKSFISEMDLLRLRKALLMCRLAANGTALVDKKKPGFSTKLDELRDLLGRLLEEDDRKIILFSEWTGMLDLVEPILEEHQRGFVRLDGSVPQAKRQSLVNRFQKRPACQVFLTTNAGSTGLNLQAANTIVNVDLPWNPAVLEQRIARAHRMGQKRPVQVYLLITEGTIEERLLGVLGAKRDLALAALDPEANVDHVAMASGMDELKSRLEVLLGKKPDAALELAGGKAAERARRERIETAGGRLLSAAFDFLSEMLPVREGESAGMPAPALGGQIYDSLAQCVEKDDAGRLRLSVALPDDTALKNLAKALGRAMSAQ